MFWKRKIMGNVALGSCYTLLKIFLHVCIMFYHKCLITSQGKINWKGTPEACDVEPNKLFFSNLVFTYLDNPGIFYVIHIASLIKPYSRWGHRYSEFTQTLQRCGRKECFLLISKHSLQQETKRTKNFHARVLSI